MKPIHIVALAICLMMAYSYKSHDRTRLKHKHKNKHMNKNKNRRSVYQLTPDGRTLTLAQNDNGFVDLTRFR
jgi:hypothetical protein